MAKGRQMSGGKEKNVDVKDLYENIYEKFRGCGSRPGDGHFGNL
jgi:hypothetical protein